MDGRPLRGRVPGRPHRAGVNALTETVNCYSEAKLIHGPAPRHPRRGRRLATLGWGHSHNTARLHGYLDDVPPAELKTAFSVIHGSDQTLLAVPEPEPPSDPGRFTTSRVHPAWLPSWDPRRAWR